MDFKPGIAHKIEIIVTEKDTANHYGSGGVDVYATPAMVAGMENAAMSAVEPYLENGYATVGTTVDISHVAATPIGMKVSITAELVEAAGSRLVFKVAAYDEAGLIGEGIHERCIVNLEKFMDRVKSKGKK